MILFGKTAKEQIDAEIVKKLSAIAEKGERVRLRTFRAQDDPSQIAYESQIKKRCAALGIEAESETIESESALCGAIRNAGADPSVDGILLFKPLPKNWDAEAVANCIAKEKDIDGARTERGDFVPCTAEACIRLIRAYGIDPCGKRCVVVGRSATVGRPLREELERLGASVTVCHSQTTDLPAETRKAELLFVACGKPKLIGADCVSQGQIVIDVGFHSDENGICGDVDAEAIAPIAAGYSPVPRGVGTVTMPTLLLHAVEAHERRTNR